MLARCQLSVKDPDKAAVQLTTAIVDRAAPAVDRAAAVHALGCLLGMTRRAIPRAVVDPFEPHPSSGIGWFVAGVSEFVLANLRTSVVLEDRVPVVIEALAQAFCDPTPELRDTAEGEVRGMLMHFAALVLRRAASSCAAPRAVVAVAAVEARALAVVEDRQKGGWRGNDTDPPLLGAYAQLLEEAARSERAEVAARAGAALAALGEALDTAVLAWARAADREALSVSADALKVPQLGPALRRGAPAFRARMSDPDHRIRLTAATNVWRIEGRSTELLDALAAGLWKGYEPPAPQADPAAGATLTALLARVDAKPQPSALWIDLSSELRGLAKLGPFAAPALAQIRACMSLTESKLRGAEFVQKEAARALAFVGRDRRALPMLRSRYDRFAEADDAQAILYLEPGDRAVRRALKLERGQTLLAAVTRRALQGQDVDWLIRILLWPEQGASGKGP